MSHFLFTALIYMSMNIHLYGRQCVNLYGTANDAIRHSSVIYENLVFSPARNTSSLTLFNSKWSDQGPVFNFFKSLMWSKSITRSG